MNLFGYASAHIGTTGSGSGASNSTNTATLKDSFENVGIEVNEELYRAYENYEFTENQKAEADKADQESENKPQTDNLSFQVNEVPLSDQNVYSEEKWKQYESFSDVAIMVISRTGGEAKDDPHGYLEIQDSEKQLLTEIEERFETVIVLINSGNALEMGFLDDENVDGAMLINYPGSTGAYAVAKILTGETNPSGKTVDTYAYDHTGNPTYYTCGLEATRKYTGIEDDKMGIGYYYTDCKEGIYVGYRYYETRYVDNETGKIDEEGYKKDVQYPFGYGLSYTTFEQKITSVEGELSENGGDTVTVNVKVTNTGDRAGKDVVQLYNTAPYYKGEIEKSHVTLVDFAKTDELQPGESTEISLTFKVQDLASYDYNDANKDGHKGYEMDKGDYVLSIRSDAHHVIDSVTKSLDKTIDFDVDSTTGAEIANRFDDVAGGDETEDIIYLSRADWEGTWPVSDGKPDSALTGTHNFGYDGTYTEGREASEAVKNSTTEAIERDYANEDDISIEMPVTGAKNNLTLSDMVGLEYDDPKWEELLDQLTIKGMQQLVSSGGYSIGGCDEIGLDALSAVDGPASINAAFSMNGGEDSISCYGYPNETMVACTWNKNLAYEQGSSMAMEADAVSVVELYAPAVNIHRSPYSGRNYEYYSEDGTLTGMMGASMAQGAADNKLLCTVKHFGLNDMETARNMNGLYTWCNEQAIREIFLKGFELTVKNSDIRGVMSSFNRIGTEWTGSSKPLLTDLLRNEWGFVGMVETDAFFPAFGDDTFYMSPNAGIRAGNDLWLQSGSAYAPDTDINEAYSVYCMRNACHNILYALTQTNAAEMSNSGVSAWAIILIAVSAVIYLGAIAAFYFMFIHKRVKKESKIEIVK